MKYRKIKLGLMLILSVFALSAQAEIYKWVDADGKIQYGDAPPKEAKTKKVSGGVTVVPAIAPAPAPKVAEKQKTEETPAAEVSRGGAITRNPESAAAKDAMSPDSAAAVRQRAIARCEENRGTDCEAEVDQQLYGVPGTTYVPGWTQLPIRPARKPAPRPVQSAPARVIKEVPNAPTTKGKLDR